MFDIVEDIDQWEKGFLSKYSFLQSLVVILIFLLCAWLCKRAINHWIRKKEIVNTKFAMRIVKITLYTIATYGCLPLLTPFESVLGKIWESAGIITVVLGLAAQESMDNFVNGLLTTAFKPFKIDNLVKVNNGEYEGYVADISLRDTVIGAYENTKVIIPNNTVNKAVLEDVSPINHTKGNFLTLDIAYEGDLDKATNIMKEEIIRHPAYVDPRTEEDMRNHVEPVIARFTSFDDSFLTLRATVYSRDNSEGSAMLPDLHIAIKRRFDQEGIEFPYPHRTTIYKEKNNSIADSR